MEQRRPQSVVTRFFLFSGAHTSTRVHFMPAVSASTAPTDILCAFTIFGRGIEPKRVVLDGAKAGQPDGIRLEDAFPSLKGEASAGIMGIELELSSSHPRINLLSSLVMIELMGNQFSVVYPADPFALPPVLESEVEGLGVVLGPRRLGHSFLAVSDTLVSSSLVLLNASKSDVRPGLHCVVQGETRPLHVGMVLPGSVLEVPLDELLFKHSQTQQVGSFSTRAESVHLAEALPLGMAAYMLFREVESRRPISVMGL